MRMHTRHVHKPGDIFGEYPNQWVACAKADMRFVRIEDGQATDMLGAPIARRIPAVHISGLGMFGEKRPCMRVIEIARCQTVWPRGEHKPEDYAGCILRNQFMEDDRYDDQPGFPEYVACDDVITSRGIYRGWRLHDEPVIGTGDVLSWIVAAEREKGNRFGELLRTKEQARAVRLVLEEMVGYGVHGTRVGDASTSIGMRLERVGRWTYTFRASGNGREARSFADAACSVPSECSA